MYSENPLEIVKRAISATDLNHRSYQRPYHAVKKSVSDNLEHER
jgi:hypothetical protein